MGIIKRFRETILSDKEPTDDNILWLDISEEIPILRFKEQGIWQGLSGGGGGDPVVSKDLEIAYFYGGSNEEITTIEEIEETLSSLYTSKKTSVSTTMDKAYHYIILYKDYNVSKVITANNEIITSSFIKKKDFTMDDIEYKLYEFHLNSGLPLDVTATIIITD